MHQTIQCRRLGLRPRPRWGSS